MKDWWQLQYFIFKNTAAGFWYTTSSSNHVPHCSKLFEWAHSEMDVRKRFIAWFIQIYIWCLDAFCVYVIYKKKWMNLDLSCFRQHVNWPQCTCIYFTLAAAMSYCTIRWLHPTANSLLSFRHVSPVTSELVTGSSLCNLRLLSKFHTCREEPRTQCPLEVWKYMLLLKKRGGP